MTSAAVREDRAGAVAGIRAVLSSCVRNAPTEFALALVLTLVAGLTGPAAAWALQRIVDSVGAESAGADGAVTRSVALLVVVTFAVATLPSVTRYVLAQLGRTVGMAANVELYAAINRIERLDEFEHPDFQDELHLAQDACQSASIQMASALTEALRNVTAAVTYALLVAQTRESLLLVVVLASAPMLWSVVQEGRRQIAILGHSAPLTRKMVFFSSLMSEPQAVKELRVFGLGDYFMVRMTRELRRLQALQRRAELRALGDELVATVLSAACAATAIWYVANEAVAGRLTAGAVVAVAASVGGTTAALSGAAGGLVGTWEAGALYRHLVRLERRVPAAVDRAPGDGAQPPVRREEAMLSVRNVSFAYPGAREALHDVSFEVGGGQSLAIVGANGAGKSTLLKVLARIYRPVSGEVVWQGSDIWEQRPDMYLDQVSAVFQDFMTYDLTVAENIAIGDLPRGQERDGPSQARVERAAHQAGADSFVHALSHGYDTLLSRTFAGDQGDDVAFLSGGQWQRLALARALVRDAPVLILDEPTSGGDVSVERRFRELIRARDGAGITLCVSHRLSLVKDCSTIVVLDEGRVVERGTHAELVNAGGTYAHMYAEQASAYAPSDLVTSTETVR